MVVPPAVPGLGSSRGMALGTCTMLGAAGWESCLCCVMAGDASGAVFRTGDFKLQVVLGRSYFYSVCVGPKNRPDWV